MNREQAVPSIQHTVTHSYTPIPGMAIEAGQSTVYKAVDDDLGRMVGLKRIHIEGATPEERRENYNRIRSEIQPLIQLGAEGARVPQVYDRWYDEKAGDFYYAMQWIEGQSIEDRMRQAEKVGQLPSKGIQEIQMLQWMIDLCGILGKMEIRNLAHKDIKPANLMIDNDAQLWLIDFGISIATSNLVEGTEGYCAPEMRERRLSVGRNKVDMYAIGIILYRYYTGIIPRLGMEYARPGKFDKNADPNSWKKFKAPIEYNAQMPQEMNEIVLRCTKYSPRDRYRDAADLSHEIGKVLNRIRKENRAKWQNKPRKRQENTRQQRNNSARR